LAKSHHIKLRQTYERKGKNALFMSNKYHAAKQMQRARVQVKSLKNYLGRVIRDIKRSCEGNEHLQEIFADIVFHHFNDGILSKSSAESSDFVRRCEPLAPAKAGAAKTTFY
jgi:hypothetical protein